MNQFAGQKVLTLETYKRNGEGVRTPLFFVERDGIFYMRTPLQSWKVKRIKNNPCVRLVSSDFWGNPKGNWVEGQGEVVPESQMAWVNELSKQKYGWIKRLMDIRNRLLGRAGKFAVIVVRIGAGCNGR